MKRAPRPDNESERQQALEEFKILDTAPEASFDQITQLAAKICQTKISLVSLVDSERQWFKSSFGLQAQETPRDVSFCGHTIMGTDLFEVTDAALHPDFCNNPLFLHEPHVRFYAGVPLVTSKGFRIGTLCVIDSEPKNLNDLQKESLKVLADQVVNLLELKLHRDQFQLISHQLQEAQEIAQIGSWQFNIETGQQTWSLEHYRLFEIQDPQPSHILYQMYRDRIHPEDLPTLDRHIERALKNGEDFVFDHRVVLDNGQRIKYVQGIGRVTKDASGAPVLISGTCRDRTQDVEKDSQYRSLFEAMSEGFVVQNSKGEIVKFNRAALEILALSSDQLLGRTSYDPRWRAIKEDGSDFPGTEHPAMVALRTEKPVYNVKMGLKLPTGHTRWILINAVPDQTTSGPRVMCTFSDISKLIETQEENNFILETLGIGVWKFNPKTEQLFWDQSMYKVFDCTPEDFTGTYESWENSLTPESKGKTVATLQRALRGEQEFDDTFEIQTRTGQRKFIGARGRVIRDADNQPLMMYGINWDRTHEVMNERQIEEQKVLLESVLNHLPNLVFVKDAKNGFRFNLINKAGEKFFGMSSSEFIQKAESNFFPKELTEKYDAFDREIVRTRQSVKVDREIIQTPHGERILKSQIVPTFKSDGSPDLLIGISTDITEEVELTKALENERAKALHSAKLASLGEMSAGIAHEINNPLAVIAAALQLLKKCKDDPVKFEAKIESIQKASDRISKIVRGLRKFSRTSEGLEHKPEGLRQIVLEAVTMTEVKAHRNYTPVLVEIESDSKILCDSVEIEQVLINLINNGIDAVKDLPEKWIKVRIFDEGSNVVMQVMDSGPGISTQIEQKLFQPFFTTKPVGEGTGLGLSITKGILDTHKATIHLNRSFKNTCFEIRFQKHTKEATHAA